MCENTADFDHQIGQLLYIGQYELVYFLTEQGSLFAYLLLRFSQILGYILKIADIDTSDNNFLEFV